MSPVVRKYRLHATLILGIASFALLFPLTTHAYHTVSGSITTSFPAVVEVSPVSFHASLTITDTSVNSAPPGDSDAGDDKYVTNIVFWPSCGAVVDGVCTQVNGGVFDITNVTGANCGFYVPVTFAVSNGFASGEYDITPTSPFVLDPLNDTYKKCVIEFDVTATNAPPPGSDTDPNTGGIQTLQVGSADLTGQDSGGVGKALGTTVTTFVSQPMFVIGDAEAHAIGDTVNFWGSQWWKNNIMSGFVNAGYPAFKGYATSADNFCGGTWTTRPGNSSNPPNAIPTNVEVIVTSTVHKNGSDISGDIKQLLMVHSDGGYGPAPGHQGNGPVTSVVCR